MPGLEEELKKRVNKPVDILPRSDDGQVIGKETSGASLRPSTGGASLSESVAHFQSDAPSCPNCGNIVVRNGACYKCLNCGESLGCS